MVDRMMALRFGRYDLATGPTGARTEPIVGSALGALHVGASAEGIRAGGEVSAETGKIGLGMLAVMVVGVMAFYAITKDRQF